jgi:hypothetical protein
MIPMQIVGQQETTIGGRFAVTPFPIALVHEDRCIPDCVCVNTAMSANAVVSLFHVPAGYVWADTHVDL